MPSEPATVVCIDPDHSFHEALSDELAHDTVRVEGVADISAARDAVFSQRVAAMVLDPAAEDPDPVHLIKRIRTHAPWVRLVVRSDDRSFERARTLLNAGVSGLFPKDASVADLAEAIRGLLRESRLTNTAPLQAETVASNAPGFLAQITREGVITFANRALPGIAVSELQGLRLGDLVAPSQRARIQRAVDRVFTTGIAEQFEAYGWSKSGSARWLDCRLGPVLADGTINGAVVIASDITDRKTTEALLEGQNAVLEQIATDAPLRTVLETIVQMIEMTGAETFGCIDLVEENGKQLWHAAGPSLPFGYERVFDPTNSQEPSIRGLHADPETGPMVVDLNEHRSPTGSLLAAHGARFARVFPIIGADGSTVAVLTLFVARLDNADDALISVALRLAALAIERRANATRLADREMRLRVILHQMPAIVWTTDTDLRFTSSTGAALGDTPTDSPEFIGKPVRSIFDDDDLADFVEAKHREALAGRTAFYEIAWRDTQFRSHVEAMRDCSGQIIGTIGVALDITENKRAHATVRRIEDELRQAQKMEAIGQLAGGIAHDFNNTLMVIIGSLDFAWEKLEPDHPARTQLARIKQAAEQGRGIANALLSFTRKSPIKRAPIDIAQVSTRTIDLLRQSLPSLVNIETNISPEDQVWVMGDAIRVQQMIMNLAINARDAMPDGGRLTISLERQHGPEPTALLTVRDTGTGMTPDVIEKIFEPYFTTKSREHGTGLGLSIIHGIVAEHEGTIDVESEVGVGTAFKVSLPLIHVDSTARGESARPRRDSALNTGLAVLAEHHPQVRAVVSSMLEGYGFDVMSFARAEDAEAAIREHRDHSTLLMIGQELSDKTGYAVVEELRAAQIETPAIIMTSHDADQPTELPANTSLRQKPFNVNDLYADICTFLSKVEHGQGRAPDEPPNVVVKTTSQQAGDLSAKVGERLGR